MRCAMHEVEPGCATSDARRRSDTHERYKAHIDAYIADYDETAEPFV